MISAKTEPAPTVDWSIECEKKERKKERESQRESNNKTKPGIKHNPTN
jgi:hypothetical protein